MSNINVSIPAELTQSMIIRGCKIADETLALELALELHDVIGKVTALRLADRRTLVEHPKGPDGKDDPNAEPIVLEPERGPNALEVADFQLAAWLVALGIGRDGDGAWVSEELAGLTPIDDPDQLFERWMAVADAIEGADDGADDASGMSF
jgi:hypothetical protein